jgi:hypothetical protein
MGRREEGRQELRARGERGKQRNADPISGLVSSGANKCEFSDARKKPEKRIKRTIF